MINGHSHPSTGLSDRELLIKVYTLVEGLEAQVQDLKAVVADMARHAADVSTLRERVNNLQRLTYAALGLAVGEALILLRELVLRGLSGGP